LSTPENVVPKLPVYLDNSATTPVDPRVVDTMLPWLSTRFGNPASSSHAFGREARAAVEAARSMVANLINADAQEIVWTSGATESNNLALKGAALANEARGRHLLSVRTEHNAVLDTLRDLEARGFALTLLVPEQSGLLDLAKFEAALRPDTVLASVMLVNNEIGVIQDIAAIGAICRARGILLHVDAAQATGKAAIDVRNMPLDLMSLTAHKTYGPKGIGALYIRRGLSLPLVPQMHGGGHERGMRSGTLPTHQIVGMGECFRIAGAEMATEVPRLRAMRDKLWRGLGALECVRVNGDMQRRIANNLNVSIMLPDCDQMIAMLTDVAVSSASACMGGGASHVLQALYGGQPVPNAIRITVGRFNTDEEIDFALDYLTRKINDCRARTAAPVNA
jgi:cysteine desulfurase